MPGTFERTDASQAQWLYGAAIQHTHSALLLAQLPSKTEGREGKKTVMGRNFSLGIKR